MNSAEMIRCVDQGANLYLRFFGNAAHMQYHKGEHYSYIRPRLGEAGVSFVFDTDLEGLPAEKQMECIAHIRALHMPVWWGLCLSPSLRSLICGAEEGTENSDQEELYMALLPGAQVKAGVPEAARIQKVGSAEAFREWADAVNRFLHSGYPYIHPAHHYPSCEGGILHCFSCHQGDTLVATASILTCAGICSLEFVATHPKYRRRGYARAVCAAAIRDAFSGGAKIITLRASEEGTKELYTSLNFQVLNGALI